MNSTNHHDENDASPLQDLFDRLPSKDAATRNRDGWGADLPPRLRLTPRTARRLELRSARSRLGAEVAPRGGLWEAPDHGSGCDCNHGRDELEAVGLEIDELEDEDFEDDVEAVEP